MDSKDSYIKIIEKAIQACIDRDASLFASFFADGGEIVLKKDYRISQPEIAQISQNYFANLAYIQIDIKNIISEGNHLCVEWSWEDFNPLTGQKNCHDNVILVTFQGDLIKSWREYRG